MLNFSFSPDHHNQKKIFLRNFPDIFYEWMQLVNYENLPSLRPCMLAYSHTCIHRHVYISSKKQN